MNYKWLLKLFLEQSEILLIFKLNIIISAKNLNLIQPAEFFLNGLNSETIHVTYNV